MAEQPVVLMPTDHHGADTQHRSCPPARRPLASQGGCQWGPQIALLVAPQIGPDRRPGLATLSIHEFCASGL